MANNYPSSDRSARPRNRRGFPVWLLCLLLFAVLVFFSVTVVPDYLAEHGDPQPLLQTEAGASSSPAGDAAQNGAGGSADGASDVSNGADASMAGSTDASIADGAPSAGAEPAEILVEESPSAGAGADGEAAPAPAADSAGAQEAGASSAPENELLVADGYGVPEWGHVHRWHNGVCAVCGETPEFYTDYLPEEFYQEAAHPGTVEKVEYEVKAYANNGFGSYQKAINVYLPYGYDEAKQYNVLVLVHGDDSDEDSWLNEVHPSGDYFMRGRDILDNLFEKGIAEPCIVVCPRVYTPQVQGLTAGINQLRDELREFILPTVAEQYATYASDGSLESLQAARDHFALGGLSNGALFVYEGGMRYNFDLFGSYAAFSGNGEPWNTVAILQRTDAYKDLPINCYFTGAGTHNDWQQNYTKIGYEYFLEHEPRVVEGQNAWRVDVDGMHEWKVWFTCLYNALPLLFPS